VTADGEYRMAAIVKVRRHVRLRTCSGGAILLAGLLAAGAAHAQDLPTGITVGSISKGPGTEGSSTIYLASAKNGQPGAFTLSIAYPSELLVFKKIESDLADVFGFTVTTSVKQQDEGKTTVLDVDVRFKEPGKDKVIPDGPVARVVFEISKAAKLDSEIPLRASVVATTADVPPKELTPVKAYDGKVTVSGEDVTACFFYMH
jgi:hypothetical protein